MKSDNQLQIDVMEERRVGKAAAEIGDDQFAVMLLHRLVVRHRVGIIGEDDEQDERGKQRRRRRVIGGRRREALAPARKRPFGAVSRQHDD